MNLKKGALSGVALTCLIILATAVGGPPKANAELVIGQPIQPTTSYPGILDLARRELSRNVRERRGNNIPRYHMGRGRIAPYSIKDAWCAAFATWVWNKAGFKDYLGTSILWKAYGGKRVAVQVTDLTRWAKRTGHFSTRAQPGYLVAYGKTHIGIVEEADRKGRAVLSIEGNQADGVNEVIINMPDVTGYISPEVLSARQVAKMRTLRPDM
ncbi:MAG TPA: CHAP domain-containing protein [Solirubrobacterales bacterium]|nr:CHAP domain-containing protein [Solirubrobacterales bacterium]